MGKKDKTDALKNLFKKYTVLDINQIAKVLETESNKTIFRYLKELGHLTSYTHNGRYYTLPEMAQFDENGFWYYGDIGFSERGTLVNTLAHIITQSESGKTNSELEKYFRTRVQDALRTLLNSNKITRQKIANHNLYVNPNPSISQQQIKKRQKVGKREKLLPWIIAEILIACVQTLSGSPNIEEVMKWLKKKGSSITKEQVEQVFEEENLEKKTLD